MFGMFKVKKEPETPAEEKLEIIKNLLFPPMELREKFDENTQQVIKYHIDYSIDSNLDSVLADLEEGYNDASCHKTINNAIKTLNDIRSLLEAYWNLDSDAKYIIVDTKNEEKEINIEE